MDRVSSNQTRDQDKYIDNESINRNRRILKPRPLNRNPTQIQISKILKNRSRDIQIGLLATRT